MGRSTVKLSLVYNLPIAVKNTQQPWWSADMHTNKNRKLKKGAHELLHEGKITGVGGDGEWDRIVLWVWSLCTEYKYGIVRYYKWNEKTQHPAWKALSLLVLENYASMAQGTTGRAERLKEPDYHGVCNETVSPKNDHTNKTGIMLILVDIIIWKERNGVRSHR